MHDHPKTPYVVHSPGFDASSSTGRTLSQSTRKTQQPTLIDRRRPTPWQRRGQALKGAQRVSPVFSLWQRLSPPYLALGAFWHGHAQLLVPHSCQTARQLVLAPEEVPVDLQHDIHAHKLPAADFVCLLYKCTSCRSATILGSALHMIRSLEKYIRYPWLSLAARVANLPRHAAAA